MSKILYVCHRNVTFSNKDEEKIAEICNSLNPDNITPNPTRTFKNGTSAYGISNPLGNLNLVGNNILFGKLFDQTEDWQNINKDYPDGNFAIFRADENSFEFVSDIVSSRTIWYYYDENLFIAATSQRAIINYLGDFQFEKKLIPWMISSGTLGPLYSWDKRLKRLPPSSSLVLNRLSWNLDLKTEPVKFSPNDFSDAEFEKKLKETLFHTFNSLDFNYSKWALSLSGGHDCRAIIAMFRQTNKPLEKLKTITWGLKTAEKQKKNDAYVAKKVAEKFHTKHTFYSTDISKEPIDKLMARFLKNGEGRVDHVSGYMDGFTIWKTLFEQKLEGVIRGNQVFGQKKPVSEYAVRSANDLALCTDFENLKKFPYIDSLKQDLPPLYNRKEDETLSMWRDRLVQEYRLPVVQAALSDLKFPYLDQFDPLLSKELIHLVRQLPDHLRDEKFLFQKVVKSLNPNLEYASLIAIQRKKSILLNRELVNLIKMELSTEKAKSIFPKEFLEQITLKLQTENKEHSFSIIKKYISDKLPLKLKKKIYRKVLAPSLDINILGFRVFLICKMNELLQMDASGKS